MNCVTSAENPSIKTLSPTTIPHEVKVEKQHTSLTRAVIKPTTQNNL
jgi:hypothetical protein